MPGKGLTAKGNELIGILQDMLEAKGDGTSVTVEEIVKYTQENTDAPLSVASVRGRMSRLINDGYITSKAAEVDEEGKKRKFISLTPEGWEVDVAAFSTEEEVE